MSVCQLECEGGGYGAEIVAVLGVARAEEGCSKAVFGKDTLGNSLSNRSSCTSEPIQPEGMRFGETLGPELDIAEHGTSRPSETVAFLERWPSDVPSATMS